MSKPAPLGPNADHTGQARLFAPAELRAPRRERDPTLTAPKPPAYRQGREVNIAVLARGDAGCFAGFRTLYGPPIDAAIRTVMEATDAHASMIRVEDGEALAGEPGVLAFYAPSVGGRMAPFALADGLTLDEARAALRRAA